MLACSSIFPLDIQSILWYAIDMRKRYIAYYRVSTKKQKVSGLGLEVQQADVERLIEREGGELIACYTEIETGKKSGRPELAKAIQHAKMANAILVVAKLDRLARNVAFTATLMRSAVQFVCCDCPGADHLHVHILAAFAEHEAKMISERTTKALAAAKARGVRLGSKKPGRWLNKQNNWAGAKAKAVTACQQKARGHYESLLPEIKARRDAGHTVGEIADWLNSNGYVTSAQRPFTVPAVWRILKRYFGASRLCKVTA